MQIRSIPLLCILTALLLFSNVAQAELTIDSLLSDATITIAGVAQSSSTSGNLGLQVSPSLSPFSTAQITDLNLTLDEALMFDFGFGVVTLDTAPASIQLQQISPGPAGSVIGGSFDQQDNLLAVSGEANLTDPTGLAGGSMLIDLATLGNQIVNFENVIISELEDVVTVDLTYSITGVANGLDVSIDGRAVASGVATAVPEPATAGILCGATCLVLLKRRRL